MILQGAGYQYVWCHCMDCGHHAARSLELTAGRRLRCSHCGSRNCERRIVWSEGRPPDNVIDLVERRRGEAG